MMEIVTTSYFFRGLCMSFLVGLITPGLAVANDCIPQCELRYESCAQTTAPDCNAQSILSKAQEKSPPVSKVPLAVIDDLSAPGSNNIVEVCMKMLDSCLKARSYCVTGCSSVAPPAAAPVPVTPNTSVLTSPAVTPSSTNIPPPAPMLSSDAAIAPAPVPATAPLNATAPVPAAAPVPAPAPVTPTNEYDALLVQAKNTQQQDAQYLRNLEATWIKVTAIVEAEALDSISKVQILNKFLTDFPQNNPYVQTAKAYIEILKSGKSKVATNDYIDPDYLREKTEWLGLRFGIGSHGASINLDLLTIRWRYVVWTLFRG
ncbi:MAG: hypothetical protein JXX14_07445, partial [Deltaproteobacteria bacterium]|nr:hypothetical protein [Deltaproteobacteria bacterium]